MDLAVYTNGGLKIGLGHTYRIKEFLEKSKLKAEIFCLKNPDFEQGRELLQAKTLDKKEDLFKIKADILLIDSFDGDVDEEFLSKLRKLFKLVLIDDENYLSYYDVDILISPSIYAPNLGYKGVNTSFFFAPYFLREEFFDYESKLNVSLKNIILTLGGSDDKDLSSSITKELSSLLAGTCLHLHVVAGAAFKQDLSKLEDDHVSVYKSPKMAALMSKMDVGICASGQSLYEFFTLKIPTLSLSLAKNQEPLNDFACKRGMSMRADLGNLSEQILSLDLNARALIRSNITRYFDISRAKKDELFAELLNEFLKPKKL